MLRHLIKDEKGSTESAMVLIPVIFLFLCSMQLVIALLYRNMALVDIQSQASSRAISGEASYGDSMRNIPSPDRFQDLKMLVVKKQRDIPSLIPVFGNLMWNRLKSEVTGVAVVESLP